MKEYIALRKLSTIDEVTSCLLEGLQLKVNDAYIKQGGTHKLFVFFFIRVHRSAIQICFEPVLTW